jgi:diacylglycerol kinase family enzyme
MIREPKPAAVLIVNPNAGRVSEQTREDVVAALRARFDIEAYATTARDTGITLASKAVEAGAALVIAYGGDGHVNEVANGVAGTEASLGIVPGGTMDVFARALKVPLDPFKAIDRILALLPRERKTVSLGRMDERYFTFSAGCGFDAEAAERVERYVPAKRRFGQLFFYWSAFRVLASTYRHRAPAMNIKGDFGEVDVAMAIASNTGPYAYIGNRAVRIAPNVKLDAGIDVFALKTMRIEALPAYAWRCLVTGDLVRHPDAFYESNLDWFEVRADKPFHRHVDGEPLPAARRARFSIVPDILKVVA